MPEGQTDPDDAEGGGANPPRHERPAGETADAIAKEGSPPAAPARKARQGAEIERLRAEGKLPPPKPEAP